MATSARYEPQYRPSSDRDYRLLQIAAQNPLEDQLQKLEQMGQRAGIANATANAQNDVLSGGNPSAKIPLSPAAIAYNASMHEAYAVRTETQIKSKVAEISSRFDGRNATDPQNFAQLYDSSVGEIANSVPADMRPRVEFEIQARRAEALGNLTARAQEHQYQLNTATVKFGIDSDIEEAATRARLMHSPEKAGLLLGKAFGRIDKGVELGMWNPEQAGLMKRDAEFRIQAENIFGTATARGTLESTYNGVVSGSIAPELPIEVRDRLARQLSSEIGHRNSQAAHARAAHAAGVKTNTYLAKTITEKIKNNVPLSPGEAQFKERVLSGKAEIKPGGVDALSTAAKHSVDYSIITAGPPEAADAYVSRMKAELPSDIAAAKRIKLAEESAKEWRAGLTGDDPTSHLIEHGSISNPDSGAPPPAINFENIEKFRATAADRRQRLDVATDQFGREFPLLTNSEISQLRTALDTVRDDPAQQLLMLGTLTEVEGKDRARKVLAKLDAQGGRNYAIMGALTAEGEAGLAGEVAAAATIEPKMKTALFHLEGSNSTSVDADFQSSFSRMYVADPTEAGIHLDAAKELYAARAWRNGWTYDKEKFEKVAAEAIGGVETVETGRWGWGGSVSKVPTLRDSVGSPVSLQERVDDLAAADIEALGGTNIDNEENPDYVASLIRTTGQFVPVAGGVNVIIERNGGLETLADRNGDPFVLRFDQAR